MNALPRSSISNDGLPTHPPPARSPSLSGTPQEQERWKRAVNATNGALGEMVGRVYVGRYFPAAAKTQLKEMVATIVAAFDRRLDGLTWMSAKTKASAKAKLASLRIGI